MAAPQELMAIGKSRNRTRSERQDLRYRILLHTGDTKVVGQAQWNYHLHQTRNLIRTAESAHLRQRLASDERLALVAPGLVAYENEQNSQLVFEARHDLAPPPRSPRSNWDQLRQAWLYLAPILTRQQADELMLTGQPRVLVGNPWDQQGLIVIP